MQNSLHETVIMLDANEAVDDKKELKAFQKSLALVDAVALLNPTAAKESTYLWGRNRLDYVFLSKGLQQAAVKAGHHLFHQHIISDHKGIYVHFNAFEFFELEEMDRAHFVHRKLVLHRRDITQRYILKLEELYRDHQILQRVDALDKNLKGL